MIYQKAFDSPIKDWFISDQYFVYQTPNDEVDDTVVVMLKLSDEGNTSGLTITLKELPDLAFTKQAYVRP